MAAYPDQVFVKVPKDLVQIGLDGSVRRLKLPARRDLTIDSAGRLWFACQLTAGCSYDPAHPDQPQSIQFPPTSLYAQVVHDSLGRIWAADPERAFLMENGRAVRDARKAAKPEDGPARAPAHRPQWPALVPRRNRPRPDSQNRFPRDRSMTAPITIASRPPPASKTVAAIFGWRRSGKAWWNGSPIPNGSAGFRKISARNRRSKWYAIRRVPKSSPLRRMSTARIRTADRWLPITKQPYRYYALLPLDGGEFLASIRDFGLARLSAQGAVVEHIPNLVPQMDEYREIVRDGKGRLWVGTKRALLRIEGRPGSFELRPETLPEVPARESADPGGLWNWTPPAACGRLFAVAWRGSTIRINGTRS